MLALLFFCSGALALVYEMLWMRQFALLFGGTVAAATATLSGFFLGLAVGSALFGARARRWRRPLLAFGLLEGGVGLGAVVAMLLFEGARALQPVAYSLDPHAPGRVLAQTLLALVVVGLPAICMGGTLPALAEAAARPGQGLGRPVGRLYAINLAGAVAGTLALPYLALPWLGVDGSYAAAVVGSLIVALLACRLGWRAPARQVPERADELPPMPRPARLLALAAFSGVVTLGLQALWARMFSLVHESSLQAFAIVLVVFLVGLSGGAALACAGLRRGLRPGTLLGFAWLLGGCLIAVSPRWFHAATGGLTYLDAKSGSELLLQVASLGASIMLPATLALGVALPLLLELAGGEGRGAGAVTGALLMANTLGAIAGPLGATFVLAPRWGLWGALSALGAVTAVSQRWRRQRSCSRRSRREAWRRSRWIWPPGSGWYRSGKGATVPPPSWRLRATAGSPSTTATCWEEAPRPQRSAGRDICPCCCIRRRGGWRSSASGRASAPAPPSITRSTTCSRSRSSPTS
jgi:hypothetical protein